MPSHLRFAFSLVRPLTAGLIGVLLAPLITAEQRGVLTPPAPAKPRINGPAIYGVHPGHPFLYRIPATGDRPMKFSVDRLPHGLSLDSSTGIITGIVADAGEYAVTLRAGNSQGKAQKQFHIVAGDKLALTPPMGWSTWYMALATISGKLVRTQADAMVSSGLVNHGYSYVDIDDGWNIKVPPKGSGGEPSRKPDGSLKTNSSFPDMKGLTTYVHSKGLKIGIYISPGPSTCGGYEGSYGHEAQDARLFAQWGFDLLKYDLCSYSKLLKDRNNAEEIRKPYQLMGALLQKQDRDFLYNLCEYGLGDVTGWARQVGGNFWRTAGDVGSPEKDLWNNVSTIGFGQAANARWAGPGGWNDPDNILIGYISQHGQLLPTPLTHNEQYTYVTLWTLLDAPLIFGGDMTKLDDFTLSLLTNDEVIAVNQDSLGKQAVPVHISGSSQVWAKNLQDGSKAVGLFNSSANEAVVAVRWSDLGIHGKHRVRDLWRQKDLGQFDGEFHMSVGENGAELIAIEKD